MSYSRLINGLHLAGVEVDRKVLADLAVSDSEAFGALVGRPRKTRCTNAPIAEVGFLTQRLAFSHGTSVGSAGLLQKHSARWAERAFVAEGAELIRFALDAGVAHRVASTCRPMVPTTAPSRTCAGVPRRPGCGCSPSAPGVLERVADTVTPQPVLAVLPMLEEPPAGTRALVGPCGGDAGRGARRRAGPRQRRHRAASGGRLGFGARRLRRRFSRPLQPQDGALVGRFPVPRAAGRCGPTRVPWRAN